MFQPTWSPSGNTQYIQISGRVLTTYTSIKSLNITLDNKFKKKYFVSVINMLLIYLFASMKLEKGHKNYLALILKLCYIIIFYEIG